MAGSQGSCLEAYKNKSNPELVTSPEAKHCSGHTWAEQQPDPCSVLQDQSCSE